MKLYLLVIFCFMLFSILIRCYNNRLKHLFGSEYSCKDIMNIKIFSILNLKACIWNLIHVGIYFLLCVLFDAKNNDIYHIQIFFIGLLWYFLAPYKRTSNKPKKCNNTVYYDTNIPRYDDIIFNLTGQLIYIILYQ